MMDIFRCVRFWMDKASQGDSVEQARDKLREALELFCERASPEEVKERHSGLSRSEFKS
jgi:predicted RNase H-like HicB family nuclease